MSLWQGAKQGREKQKKVPEDEKVLGAKRGSKENDEVNLEKMCLFKKFSLERRK